MSRPRRRRGCFDVVRAAGNKPCTMIARQCRHASTRSCEQLRQMTALVCVDSSSMQSVSSSACTSHDDHAERRWKLVSR